MTQVTLSDLSNLQNETSVVNTINENNVTIEQAFAETLSTTDPTHNTMGVALDMNGNKIYNLPEATTDLEPVRKKEFDTYSATGITDGVKTLVHYEVATQLPVAVAGQQSQIDTAVASANTATTNANTAAANANAAAANANAAVESVGNLQVADHSITNAKLALAPAYTVKGNMTSASDYPTDLYPDQVMAMMSTMSASTKGLVPAPSASPSTTKFLTEAGTWAAPPTPTATAGMKVITGLGVGNDSGAIDSFIRSNGPGTYFLPPGSYTFNGTVVIDTYQVHLIFAAGVNIQAAHDDALFWIQNSSVTLEAQGQVILNGRLGASNEFVSSSRAVLVTGDVNNYRSFFRMIGPFTLQYFKGSGVWLEFCYYFEVSGLYIGSCTYAGIMCLSCSYGNIFRNRINTLRAAGVTPGGGSGTENAYGIGITKNGGALSVYPCSEYITVAFNEVLNVTTWHAYDTHGGQHIRWLYNSAFNCRTGLYVTTAPTDTGSVSAQGVEIIGNRFTGGGSYPNYGIYVYGQTSDMIGRVTISDNYLQNFGWNGSGPESPSALLVAKATIVNITNNTLNQNWFQGISLQYSGTEQGYCIVSGNNIWGWLSNGGAGINTAFYTLGSYSCVLLSGNIVQNYPNGIYANDAGASSNYGTKVARDNVFSNVTNKFYNSTVRTNIQDIDAAL